MKVFINDKFSEEEQMIRMAGYSIFNIEVEFRPGMEKDFEIDEIKPGEAFNAVCCILEGLATLQRYKEAGEVLRQHRFPWSRETRAKLAKGSERKKN